MQIIKICKSLKNRTNISSLPHLCDLRIAVLQQFGVPSPIHSSVGRKTTSLLPIQKCPFVFVFSSYLSYFCVTPLKNTKRKRSSIQFEWTTASSIIQICGYHKNRRSYFCLSVCLSVMSLFHKDIVCQSPYYHLIWILFLNFIIPQIFLFS